MPNGQALDTSVKLKIQVHNQASVSLFSGNATIDGATVPASGAAAFDGAKMGSLAKRPGGPVLKLLSLVQKPGLQMLA